MLSSHYVFPTDREEWWEDERFKTFLYQEMLTEQSKLSLQTWEKGQLIYTGCPEVTMIFFLPYSLFSITSLQHYKVITILFFPRASSLDFHSGMLSQFCTFLLSSPFCFILVNSQYTLVSVLGQSSALNFCSLFFFFLWSTCITHIHSP